MVFFLHNLLSDLSLKLAVQVFLCFCKHKYLLCCFYFFASGQSAWKVSKVGFICPESLTQALLSLVRNRHFQCVIHLILIQISKTGQVYAFQKCLKLDELNLLPRVPRTAVNSNFAADTSIYFPGVVERKFGCHCYLLQTPPSCLHVNTLEC